MYIENLTCAHVNLYAETCGNFSAESAYAWLVLLAEKKKIHMRFASFASQFRHGRNSQTTLFRKNLLSIVDNFVL